MQSFEEHAKALARAILAARDLCGNEAQAARDYFAEAGFPKGPSPERNRVLSSALDIAEREWNMSRFR